MKTSTSAAPSTSARSSALRRNSGGRVSMSHAWLIAWRSAPITPLAAANSSRTRDRAEPAGVVERVVDRALEPRAVGLLAERDVVEHRRHDALVRMSSSSKNSPKPPTSSIASGTNESTAKNAICAASRCPRSSTNSEHARRSASRARSTIRRTPRRLTHVSRCGAVCSWRGTPRRSRNYMSMNVQAYGAPARLTLRDYEVRAARSLRMLRHSRRRRRSIGSRRRIARRRRAVRTRNRCAPPPRCAAMRRHPAWARARRRRRAPPTRSSPPNDNHER